MSRHYDGAPPLDLEAIRKRLAEGGAMYEEVTREVVFDYAMATLLSVDIPALLAEIERLRAQQDRRADAEELTDWIINALDQSSEPEDRKDLDYLRGFIGAELRRRLRSRVQGPTIADVEEPVAYAIEAATRPGTRELLRLYHVDEKEFAESDTVGWTKGSAARVVPLFRAPSSERPR